MRVLAMILAGGSSPELSILTADRAEPAIPVSYTHLTLPTIYSV